MYSFDSRIRYSETDENLVLRIPALINYFQDCSTFQTEEIGAGWHYLHEQGLAWVLAYWQIDITRLPSLYERVRVGTVPYALKGFSGLRNYFMDALDEAGNETGERLAVANSFWALMDMKEMIPARMTEEHQSRYTLEEKLPMEYRDRKIRLPKEGGIEAAPLTVHAHHLDSNGHVNNGQYVAMAMEALAESGKQIAAHVPEGDGRNILRLRTEYKKQARLGDTLTPFFFEETDEEKGTRLCTVDLRLRGESCCVAELTYF
ncbi:MAG: acyl-[Lachnospiraceae bacterium]|nr:acyl-[acyl-carrier-protein] thioesterase [Lachnospiraceae bacterium]